MLLEWARRSRIHDQRRDRWLVAAAVVYGLSLGNHTLTLLLAPGIGLFVLAVEPRVFTRGRLLLATAGALVATTVLVYLELPLRAGLFRAPLVYADPSTWDGFRYVVLAEQFRSSLYQPFDRLPEKFGDLVRFADEQLGPLLYLVPFGFAATLVRRLPYAILSGVSLVITCWFSASYINAEIDRYYLVPRADRGDVDRGPRGHSPRRPRGVRDAPRRCAGAAARDRRGRAARHRDVATGPAPSRSRPEGDSFERGRGGARRAGAGDRAQREPADPDAAGAAGAEPDPRSQHRHGRRRLGAGRLAAMDPDAVIVSWWSYSTPLWYVQLIEGLRPDVWIVDDRTRLDLNLGEVSDVIDAELPSRPVYLVRLDPGEIVRLESQYELERIEMPGETLLRVVGPRETATAP